MNIPDAKGRFSFFLLKKTFLLFSEMFKCLVTTEETHKKVTLDERLRKMGKINKA